MKSAVQAWVVSLVMGVGLILSGCGGGDSSDNSSTTPPDVGVSFLVGYSGGGSFPDAAGLVKVTQDGTVSWVSKYYPRFLNVDYVDMKNGRIAMAADNPPPGFSCIAYMDIANITDVKFIPVPPSARPEDYWQVPPVRPQVMADGRIVIMVIGAHTNGDDAHWGQLAIYDPDTGSFDFSGSLSTFITTQPESQASFDVEEASMDKGMSFALSPDDSFVCLSAYGYGTEVGQLHYGPWFVVKYDIVAKNYTRVLAGKCNICFISRDANYAIANKDDGKKYRVTVNNGSLLPLDEHTDFISVGQYARKSDLFVKEWRGSGISMFDVNSGFLYNAVLGESLPQPYQGLGFGAQFSTDESLIYFKANKDFYGNSRTEFSVFSTPVAAGSTDTNPPTLFTLPSCYDNDMFLLLHN